MTAPILKPDPDAIRNASAILARGGLVAMPTETVYGLAADAASPAAVAARRLSPAASRASGHK